VDVQLDLNVSALGTCGTVLWVSLPPSSTAVATAVLAGHNDGNGAMLQGVVNPTWQRFDVYDYKNSFPATGTGTLHLSGSYESTN
jgi:hypothetical protein